MSISYGIETTGVFSSMICEHDVALYFSGDDANFGVAIMSVVPLTLATSERKTRT